MDIVATTAYAAPEAAVPAPSTPQGGGASFIVMLVLFLVVIYFAVWRPQNKRAKEQQNLLNSLAKGDEVMTAGGLLGRVNKIAGPYVSLGITNTVDILVQKASIVSVLPKGTLKSLET